MTWAWRSFPVKPIYLPDGTVAAKPPEPGRCWGTVHERDGRVRQCRQKARAERHTCVRHTSVEYAACALDAEVRAPEAPEVDRE